MWHNSINFLDDTVSVFAYHVLRSKNHKQANTTSMADSGSHYMSVKSGGCPYSEMCHHVTGLLVLDILKQQGGDIVEGIVHQGEEKIRGFM